MENLVELSLEEQKQIDAGIGPAAIAVGLLGFGAGVVVGAAIEYGVYYYMTH